MCRALAVILLLLGIDLATKHYFFSALQSAEQWPTFIPILSFTLAKNYGVGFGLGAHQYAAIVGTNVLILAALVSILHSSKSLCSQLATATLIAGGMGNLYDRFVFGYVRDFILLSYQGHAFPVFNIADCCISLGILLLLYCQQREQHA